MTRPSILASLARHDRMVVACGLVLAVFLSWAYLLSGAGTMQEMGGMLMPMSPAAWTTHYALLMFVMWSVMMAAMMLPGAAPMILLYATLDRHRQTRDEAPSGAGASLRTGLFAIGYLACWIAFSCLAVILQYSLEKVALLSRMMQTTSLILAGVIFIAAGSYQFSSLKQTCLRNCRSPLDFLVSHWRSGGAGAFLMGLQHGLYCLGCCWLLMLLLFVGGVMNLAWITALAAFVLIEKIIPAGHYLGKVAGGLLIAWGAGILSGHISPPG